jgi:hypothetical protein
MKKASRTTSYDNFGGIIFNIEAVQRAPHTTDPADTTMSPDEEQNNDGMVKSHRKSTKPQTQGQGYLRQLQQIMPMQFWG